MIFFKKGFIKNECYTWHTYSKYYIISVGKSENISSKNQEEDIGIHTIVS